MEDVLFIPETSDLAVMGWAVAGVVFFALGAYFLPTVKTERRNRPLVRVGVMLMYFGVLISLGTAVFAFWSYKKLVPVEFTATDMTTPYGTVAYSDITDAKIRTDAQVSFVQPKAGPGTELLIILESNGRTHALSEVNYKIRDILGEIRKRKKLDAPRRK